MRIRSRVAWVLATWFGAGLLPIAPGTFGALGAIPLYLVVVHVGRAGVGAAALVTTGVGVWAASCVAHELETSDPQVVVIDEVAGMLVTLLGSARFSWPSLGMGFLLFRLLDVLKPWPIRWFERFPGGWGIVLDDIAAGAAGAGILFALRAAHILG